MAQVWSAPAASTDVARPEVRRIGVGELGEALRRGWADFLATPTQLVFLCVLYPVIGLVAATLSAGRDVLHLFYPMAAGFALVGPIAALGLYEISRRRERGLPASWVNAFDVLRSPAIGSIAALGILLLVIFLAGSGPRIRSTAARSGGCQRGPTRGRRCSRRPRAGGSSGSATASASCSPPPCWC
jgi:uncharacterized membrane protein